MASRKRAPSRPSSGLRPLSWCIQKLAVGGFAQHLTMFRITAVRGFSGHGAVALYESRPRIEFLLAD
jgi:hypothetical protein